MIKQYICNLWRNLQMGKNIRFVDGFFETDDPKLQAIIENNGQFGANIHFKDCEEEMERQGRIRREEEASRRASERKRILDEIAAEEQADVAQKTKDKAVAEAATKTKKEDQKLAAADKLAGETLAAEEKTADIYGATQAKKR
jgi:hypothetical protein